MNINNIKAGQQCAWVYEADRDTVAKGMNKGGRGIAPNPIYGSITCRKVYCGQAATADMLSAAQLALDPTWKPSSDRAPMFEATDNPCIVRNLATGKLQARIMRPRATKVEWFVCGMPATADELAIIRQYKRQRISDPLRVKVMFPYVDNLSNVEGELATVEE